MKSFLIISFLTFVLTIFSQGSTKMVIVIDAGHGGKDPGNLHQTKGLLDEKDLNLAMALKVGGYIEQFLGHAIEVVYTRKTDEFISLEDRVKMANSINAAYFISIHCNASDNNSVVGTESHIHTFESTMSNKLAHEIQNQFKERAGRHSRGVKIKNDRLGNLLVLKESKMPAVLVETGFMTNPHEEAYLNSEKGQDIIASAIFRAFRDFVKTHHKIEMQLAEKPNEEVKNEPVWKIQIFASTGPVSLDNPDFLSLGDAVEELILSNTNSAFNYKYYVGAFKTKKDAKDKLKEIRDGVFKDAFLVKFE
jgi:N-acetylmuramoyl-L-alanine amidase